MLELESTSLIPSTVFQTVLRGALRWWRRFPQGPLWGIRESWAGEGLSFTPIVQQDQSFFYPWLSHKIHCEKGLPAKTSLRTTSFYQYSNWGSERVWCGCTMWKVSGRTRIRSWLLGQSSLHSLGSITTQSAPVYFVWTLFLWDRKSVV